MKVLFQCTYILIKKTLEIIGWTFIYFCAFSYSLLKTLLKKTQIDIASGRQFCRPQCVGKPAGRQQISQMRLIAPHRETP